MFPAPFGAASRSCHRTERGSPIGTTTTDRRTGISVANADGTGEVIQTGPELTGTAHWLWAPDSSKILMFPNDVPNDSSHSAYLLDPDGGPYTKVPWRSDMDLDWQRVAAH